MTMSSFCANCGAQLTPGTRFCDSCGTPVAAAPSASVPPPPPSYQPAPPPPPAPVAGGTFCPSCGAANAPGARFCNTCGANMTAPVAQQAAPQYAAPAPVPQAAAATGHGKSKGAAVVLAIFFVYWTWVYTWKKDKSKFLIGLGVNVLTIILGFTVFPLFSLLGYIFLWFWAVVSAASRKAEWYQNY
jgi:hypothetical protein